jgi:tRNA G10  N-methylase Trm11
MYLFFYGSHPVFSKLEIDSLLPGAVAVSTIGAIADCDESQATEVYARAGGIPKYGKVIADIQSIDLVQLEQAISHTLVESKIKKYVLSFYTNRFSFSQISKLILSIKKAEHRPKFMGKFDKKIQSPATVFHLLKKGGTEISIIEVANTFLVVQTSQVQDADYWTLIDFEKPHREKHVGMLPSKLARMMVNISKPDPKKFIWDPFCGLGTVIMQSELLGLPSIGSDVSSQALGYTEENLRWLQQKGLVPELQSETFNYDIQYPRLPEEFKEIEIGSVVTEPFLGKMRSRPFESLKEAVNEWEREVKPLIKSLLQASYHVLPDDGLLAFVKPVYSYIDNRKVKWYNPRVEFDAKKWQQLIPSDGTYIWNNAEGTILKELGLLKKHK